MTRGRLLFIGFEAVTNQGGLLSIHNSSNLVLPPTLGEMIRHCLGFAYLAWWFAKTRVMRVATHLITLTVAVGILVTLFDIVAHTSSAEVVQYLSRFHWYSRIAFTFEILWVSAIIGSLHHTIEDWRRSRQEVYFVDAVDLLLAKLDEISHSDSPLALKLELFTSEALVFTRASFKDKATVQANFAALGTDSKIRISKTDPPDAKYSPRLVFDLGEGGMGLAAQKKTIVYFPSIWIRHAIRVGFDRQERPTEFSSPGVNVDLYLPVENEFTVYKSILAVPVVWEDSPPYGVLNFDSKKRDAFDEFDFKMANVYGQILGVAFNRFSPARSIGAPAR
jgi:hypothetical protein